MDHLLRGHAPLSGPAWEAIDAEARERLTPLLAARRFVDWSGPHGWGWSGTDLGRSDVVDVPPGLSGEAGAVTRHRRLLPAVEVRVPFTVSRREIADLDRGAADLDFDALDLAARRAAEIENRAVLHGWPATGLRGIVECSSHEALPLGPDTRAYPSTVARAVDLLRRAGVVGPYALAIGPSGYTRIVESSEHGGQLLVAHLERILDGAVLWTPGLDGAVVLSRRGGDFLFESGQDLAVGYTTHDAENVELYLEETFTFRDVEPDAAVRLTD